MLWCAAPALAAVLLWMGLGGPGRDFHVPLAFSGDALFYFAQGKGTIEHGWWWHNPSIGVPLPYPALVFPQNTNVEQAVVWLVGWGTRDGVLGVNVAWIALVALSAASATWGLRRVGVSMLGAIVSGVLFAMTPYAMYRNVGHVNLAIYLVPFAATAAMLIAAGRVELTWRSRTTWVLVAGNLLLGFDYIYYAFFGTALIAAAVLLGLGRGRPRALLMTAGVWGGAIVLATALNLLPTQLAWRTYGQPGGVQHAAAESEVLGLKIRHLVSPVANHWFPPFADWQRLEQRADFPLENENAYGRLGSVGTLGFLWLLLVMVLPEGARREDDGDATAAAARLTCVALLIAMVGALGSLFSLLVASQIRGYNRIAPFIVFFSLAGLALAIDRKTQARRWGRRVVWAAVLVLGVLDQWPPLGDLAADRRVIEPEFRKIGRFISQLESGLPAGAMVFQLPIRPFPVDEGTDTMGIYDQFRPYLASRHLRWSYPALSTEQQRWQQRAAGLSPAELPSFLADEGFSAILINRWGYTDLGQSIAQSLGEGPRAPAVLSQNEDFIALDLGRR
ncbi:MAG: hypothetical protein ABI051_02205 [Vicinamibacterales bacterium]